MNLKAVGSSKLQMSLAPKVSAQNTSMFNLYKDQKLANPVSTHLKRQQETKLKAAVATDLSEPPVITGDVTNAVIKSLENFQDKDFQVVPLLTDLDSQSLTPAQKIELSKTV